MAYFSYIIVILNETIVWGGIMFKISSISVSASAVMLLIYGLFAKENVIISGSITATLLISVFYFISRKITIISKNTLSLYVIFILLSVLLGRSLNFYGLVFGWDKLLHFLSGFVLVKSADEIYLKLGGKKENKILYNIFLLCFAASFAALWEIWEFSGDKIFKTTAQNNSLADTMLDIIMGTSGGAIMVVLKNTLQRKK